MKNSMCRSVSDLTLLSVQSSPKQKKTPRNSLPKSYNSVIWNEAYAYPDSSPSQSKDSSHIKCNDQLVEEMDFYQPTTDKDIKIVTQSAMEGERDIHIMESHCASKIINDTIQELSMEDTRFDLGLKDIQHEVVLS